jgi:signal transduction histidine kinase
VTARQRHLPMRDVLARIRHPPLREPAFWAVQVMVLLLAGLHLLVDLRASLENGSFPTGVPVGLLLVPVGYAALRYGLSGSAATASWATLLWLPDLALPSGRGHPGDDLVELALVLGMAVFAGIYVERERLERARAEALEADRHTSERRFAAELVRLQEQERRRIAQELHDDPLQRLIQLARHLELADGSPARPDGPASLAGIREELLDAVNSLRESTRGLRPAGIDELGLVPALRGLLAEAEAESGVQGDLEVTGGIVRAASEVELGLFRIVQEAVRNVVRHAGATRLRILVTFDDEVLSVEVFDDGRGFDPETVRLHRDDHFGLLGMSERARLLGGDVELRSVRGEGTWVTATVPLPWSGAVAPEDGAVPGEHSSGLGEVSTRIPPAI